MTIILLKGNSSDGKIYLTILHRPALSSVDVHINWTCPHLGRFLARLTVQAAYPSALHHLVVSGVRLHLLPLKRRTVTGFQIGLLPRGFVLRWNFDRLHWFHILICLELSPNKNTNRCLYGYNLWLFPLLLSLIIVSSINFSAAFLL